MRFLIDAQLPPALADFIEARGYEAKPVKALGLRDAPDTVIWEFAIGGKWVVVTKDEDFIQRATATSRGPQIVWLRVGNSTNRVLLAWLEPQLNWILQELENGQRIVEVIRLAPQE